MSLLESAGEGQGQLGWEWKLDFPFTINTQCAVMHMTFTSNKFIKDTS